MHGIIDLQFLKMRGFLLMILFQGSLVTIDSIKDTPENAVKSVPFLLCQRKAYIYTAKGGYLKTTFVCKFCPSESEPGLHPGLCF